MGRKRGAGNEKLGEYVQRRSGGALELRFPIPPDVQHAFPKKDGTPRPYVIRSLNTSDVRLANARADGLRAGLRQQIERARSARSSDTLDDYLRALYGMEMDRFRLEVEADQVKKRKAMFAPARRSSPPESFAAAIEELNCTIDQTPRNIDLVEHGRLLWGQNLLSPDLQARRAGAAWAVDYYFEHVLGRVPDPNSPEYIAVLDRCTAVLIDAIVAQNDAGRSRPPTPPMEPALAPEPSQSDDGNVAITERGRSRLSAYFKEEYEPPLLKGVYGERTAAGKRLSIKLFTQIISDKKLFLITSSDLWEYHDRLCELPDPRYLTKEQRALPIKELIRQAKGGRVTTPLLNPKTVNRHLTGIKTLLDYAVKRRHIRLCAADGVRAEIENEEDTGRAFTTDELNRIFALPLFAGCREGLEEAGLFKPGLVKVRDDRFWIPLLLFLTGARSSEIVGLSSDDVFPDHEIPHILIRPNALRLLKNKPSKRMVPLHPYLQRMGFLEFARRRIAEVSGGQFFVMAEQKHYRDGATGTVTKKSLSNSLIMRQFNRTLLAHAEANSNRGSIKCFRNTFEQESLSSIDSDEIRRRLTGRKIDSTVTVYTQNIPDDQIKRTELLRTLDTNMRKIRFNGVSLSHLMT